jgi:hypothetical protein
MSSARQFYMAVNYTDFKWNSYADYGCGSIFKVMVKPAF